MMLSLGLPFSAAVDLLGRLTSNTKNQAVKKVPMVRRTVESSGKADGLIGEVYRSMDSIFSSVVVAGR